MLVRNGLLAVSAVLIAATAWGDDPASQPPAASEVRSWVAQLNDDNYEVREEAARRLTAAGTAAITDLVEGLASDQAEVAWRCGAALEQIALAGNDATVEKIVTELDAACAKTGREGLKSLAKDLHARQQQFRRERAIAQIRKHGGQLAGTGIEGEVEAEFGGAMAMPLGGAILIDEGFLELDAAAIPPPVAEIEMGAELPRAEIFDIFGEIGRAFGRAIAPGGDKPDEPPAEAVPPPAIVPAAPEVAPPADEPAEATAEAARAAEAAAKEAAEKAAAAEEAATDLEKAVDEAVKGLRAAVKVVPLEEVREARAVDVDIAVAEVAVAEVAIGIDAGMTTGSWAQLSLDSRWRGGDDGLAVIKDLPELVQIDLSHTKLTDKALVHLAALPKLQRLNVSQAGFSRDAMLKFHRQRPAIVIYARGNAMMGIHADTTGSPLMLTTVQERSGAAKAGLQPGDAIHQMDGVKIRDFSELTIVVSAKQPGETIKVEYERDGKKQTALVTLSQRTD